MFGLVPLGRQHIGIEYPPAERPGRYCLRDNGGGELVDVWDHCIGIDALTATRCRYTDTVTIRAGLATPVVGVLAYGFYWWRQRRWRTLVQRNFQPLAGL